MARPRHRSANQEYLLFNPNTTLGWSIARRIGLERGERMVDAGAAIRVNDELGNHIGYKLRRADEPRDPVIVASGSTSLTIVARESRINAGLMGGSRTVGMKEEDRLSRIHPLTGRLLAPEDEVERVREKILLYPVIGDLRAVRVSPLCPA